MTMQFFKTQSDLRTWFKQNYQTTAELWVGYYKKSTGLESVTWEESVETAICFGWIDGIRKSIDDKSYMIRFTPRNPKSTWSKKNIEAAGRMIAENLMTPAGLELFNLRKEDDTDIRKIEFTAALESQFRVHKKAWSFFCAQPPYYRKTVTRWVMSAKQETTRQKRLNELISDSENQLKIKAMR